MGMLYEHDEELGPFEGDGEDDRRILVSRLRIIDDGPEELLTAERAGKIVRAWERMKALVTFGNTG